MYRVSDDLVTGPNPSFRCSRCKHVFALEAKPQTQEERRSASPRATPPPEAANRDPERPFTFSQPEPETPGPEPPQQERPFESSPPQETPPPEEPSRPSFSDPRFDALFPPRENLRGPGSSEPSPSQVEEGSQPSRPFPPPESGEEARPAAAAAEISAEIDAARAAISEFADQWEQSVPADEDEEEAAAAAAFEEEQSASTVPYLTLFAVLMLVFSIAALAHQTQPTAVEGLLKNIPWFGASVFQNNHLRQGVVLQSMRASSQPIAGNREVFMVSGVAYNRNAEGVREVQIEGQVFDAQGKEIDRQAIWVGNAITPKIVKDLTAQEISILQKLSPQKRFEIPAQKGSTFVIVFFKPRGEIKDFSCRVVSAESAA